MQAFISTIVALIQLILGGFVIWGAWLVLSPYFRGEPARSTADAVATPAARAKAQADDFERVASLVLLALLCTTLMAAA